MDLAVLTQSAFRAATSAGVTGLLTLTRPAGTTVDPITGAASGSTSSQTLRAVALTARQLRGRSATWLEARVVVMVAAGDLSWTPVSGDRGTFAGKTGTITQTNAIAPGGTVIAYELAIGA